MRMQGLMSKTMALGDGYSDSADRPLQPGEQDPDKLPPEQRMEQPGQAEATQGEMPDDEFDEALERVMAAAIKAMQTPEARSQLQQIPKAQDVGIALAEFCYNLSMALYEKSGQSIPDEVMPAAGMYILGKVGEMLQVSQKDIAEAADQMTANYALSDDAEEAA